MTTEIDITSEASRTYHYEGGREFIVPEPAKLYVLNNDGGTSHRVVSTNGRTYRPERGWTGISWEPRQGAPSFVA